MSRDRRIPAPPSPRARRRQPPPWSSRTLAGDGRGMTLLEVLVAAALLAAVALPLFAGLGYGWRGVRAGRQEAVAAALLQCGAEESKAEGYAALATGPIPACREGDWTVRRTVTDIWDGKGKRVVVQVVDGDGRVRASALFLMHERGF